MDMNEYLVLSEVDFILAFTWYKVVITVTGNKIEVYFSTEMDFKDVEWTEEDKQKFKGQNSPVITQFHDGIVGGRVGFSCNNCAGASFDDIMLQQNDCIRPENSSKIRLNSPFCDR